MAVEAYGPNDLALLLQGLNGPAKVALGERAFSPRLGVVRFAVALGIANRLPLSGDRVRFALADPAIWIWSRWIHWLSSRMQKSSRRKVMSHCVKSIFMLILVVIF